MVLQAVQAQAPTLLAATNEHSGATPVASASAGAANARNPFWNMPGLSSSPMMGAGGIPGGLPGGLPGNFYPQMAAFAAAQENAAAMVAVSKLGTSKLHPATNSALVVRGSVRKFNMNGGLFSVAEWTRKTVEENLEWLVKLSKRHPGSDKAILLAYGDGCETLVLLDDQVNKMPDDFNKIKRIGVGVTMTNVDSTLEESKLAAQGVLQPSDSIWEHLRFETLASGDKSVDKCLFIHTRMTVWSDGVDGRRRVLQVTTHSGLAYKPNPMFEQQVLLQWKGQGQGPTLPMSFVPITAAAAGGTSDPEEDENVTIITFNPKELLLLEKAFDNRMTSRDRKTNVNKYTDEDKKACQFVIRRAQNEFVMRGPPRKRKKKSEEESKEDDHEHGEDADNDHDHDRDHDEEEDDHGHDDHNDDEKDEKENEHENEKQDAKKVKLESISSIKKENEKPVKSSPPKKADSSDKAKETKGSAVKKEAKASPTKKTKIAEVKPVPKSNKKAQSKKEKETEKNATKGDDEDDEPISKMVQKAESVGSAAKSRRTLGGPVNDNKPKRPGKGEPRGRNAKAVNEKSKESPPTRKRSKSKSKK